MNRAHLWRAVVVLFGMQFSLALMMPKIQAQAPAPQFEHDILPIFRTHCLKCHGQNERQAGLDLRSVDSILKGSASGPVLAKGASDRSVLFQRVSNRTMPPAGAEVSLTESEIQILRRWIDEGSFEGLTAIVSIGDRGSQESSHATRFERDVLPIFKVHCLKCHGQQSPPAGLDLQTASSVLKGGHNGPVVFSGSLEKSLLYQKVSSHAMPPPGSQRRLNDSEIGTIRRWIEGGALTEQAIVQEEAEAPQVSEKDREFWSFRKPVKHTVPKVKARQRVRTPVDAFILARLEAKGLSFSPDASKETLIRRAHYDLVGILPSADDVRLFLSDTKPGAYERLIDRLLSSPHFGERWARHWLDISGYTDMASIDNDLTIVEVKEGMWRYRDYVVRSFNEDKPYDRFLTEQLAGDELVDWRSASKFTPDILELLVATGYLRTVLDTTDPEQLNRPLDRNDLLTRVVDNVSTGLMGLTVGCARCHSHKYDPIPQKDYYRLLSIFATSYNPSEWLQPKNRYLPDVSKAEQEEIARHNAEIDRPLADVQKQLADLRRPHEQRLYEARLASVPEILRTDVRTALDTSKEKRDLVQKYLVQKYGEVLEVKPEEVDRVLSEEERKSQEKLKEKIATLTSWRRSFGKIQALWDMGPVPKVHLLYRGDIETPGPEVQPGFLGVLCGVAANKAVKPPETEGNSSGRRLAFAKWLTDRDHPLTARVMVNRIWQHLFGKGIVATPENFGHSGISPTHPELLDWLAVDFMENGWKIKRLLKLIMTSTVYRQSSLRPDEDSQSLSESIDSANDLLWRMNLRRVDAEILRDSTLAVVGKLDDKQGGPPVPLDYNPSGLLTVSNEGSTRRSLYLLARRNYPLTFLDNFDFPIMAINCTRRGNSATPLQSLTLLNSDFVMEEAESFAGRLLNLVGRDASNEKKIEMGYILALARKPTTKELKFCLTHLEKQAGRYLDLRTPTEHASKNALNYFCQMLLASNEFLYID
jgi:mono/diheme cytochrome c family protein